MAGRTGYTAVVDGDAYDPPADITAVYVHFDPLIGETVALTASLPSSGNWIGRTIYDQEAGFQKVWDGSSWEPVVDPTPFPSRVIPSAATNGSVAGDGIVTSTAQSLVRVRDAFPVTFRKFRIDFDLIMSAAVGANIRFAVGATDATASNYTNQRTTAINSTAATTPPGAVGFGEISPIGVAGARHVGHMYILNPNATDATHFYGESVVTSSGAITGTTGRTIPGGVHSLSTAYDSFTVFGASGNVTVNRLSVAGVD